MDQRYIDEVVNTIKESVTDEYDVTTTKSTKNNGVELTGVIIRSKDNFNRVEPVLYMDEFYDNGYDSAETANMILEKYQEIKQNGMPAFDVRDITNYDIIKDRIRAKLINKEQNAKYIADKPYLDYAEDLCICFYVDVNNDGTATIPITDSLMAAWGLGDSVEILYEVADENKPKMSLVSMAEAIVNMMSDMDIEIKKLMSGNEEMTNEEYRTALIESQADLIPMYVWRCGETFGASCMIYPDAVKEVQEKVGDMFYILPSSCHELIVLPYSEEYTVSDLKEMIVQVNASELDPKDVLSNHPYIVDRNGDIYVAQDNRNIIANEEIR